MNTSQFVFHAVAAVFIATNAPKNIFNHIWINEAPLQCHRCCELFWSLLISILCPTESRIIETRFLLSFPIGFVDVYKMLG